MDDFDRFLASVRTAHEMGDRFVESVGKGPVSEQIRRVVLENPEIEFITAKKTHVRRGVNPVEKAKDFCREHDRFRLVVDINDIEETRYITWREDLPDHFEVVCS